MEVTIGSGDGLVPSGNKSLIAPMLTQIYNVLVSLDHNELMNWYTLWLKRDTNWVHF